MKMENVGLLSMTAEQYHGNKEAVGHSGLVKVMRSPAHYQEYVTNPPEPTPAMAFGTALHMAVLEPAEFASVYAVFDESKLEGTLQSLDDYKIAAVTLGVKFDALNKEELKAAIKAADSESKFTFRDDVQAELAAVAQQKLEGTLRSLDDLKQAAESLGIATAKMKKDDLKAAIKAADTESKFKFREEVEAEIATLGQEQLAGALQSLDDYKIAAVTLGVKFDALNKEELKAAIKAADSESKFTFREDAIVKLYDGKQILQPSQMLAIQSIQASISRHAGAARLLSSGLAEMSGFWTDAETGIECKCRPDWLPMAGETVTGIVDVKSCCDASAEGFAKAIATMGYDLQAAYYQDGMKALTGRTLPFYFIAVEKDGPHATAVYKASDEMIEVGRAKYRGALQLMKWCRENNQWPAYQPGGEIEEINLPRWAANFNLED